MIFTLKEEDSRTTHNFKLASRTAVMSCSGWGADEGWVATYVRIGAAEPVHVGGFKIADDDDAKMLSQENSARLQSDGTLRPQFVRSGDVTDVGACHNTGGIQELCELLKLDPNDITEYEYVDLSVRAAGLAFAKKLILAHRPAPLKGDFLTKATGTI